MQRGAHLGHRQRQPLDVCRHLDAPEPARLVFRERRLDEVDDVLQPAQLALRGVERLLLELWQPGPELRSGALLGMDADGDEPSVDEHPAERDPRIIGHQAPDELAVCLGLRGRGRAMVADQMQADRCLSVGDSPEQRVDALPASITNRRRGQFERRAVQRQHGRHRAVEVHDHIRRNMPDRRDCPAQVNFELVSKPAGEIKRHGVCPGRTCDQGADEGTSRQTHFPPCACLMCSASTRSSGRRCSPSDRGGG